MAETAEAARVRLAAFAAEGEIAWPAAEGIDHAGDRTRGWTGPNLAGTYLPITDVGRNLAEHWGGCRKWYPEQTDEQCRAARDYYLAHLDLFQAQRWRDAQYERQYQPGGNRERLQADIAALLDRLAATEAEAARLREALVIERAKVLARDDTRFGAMFTPDEQYDAEARAELVAEALLPPDAGGAK